MAHDISNRWVRWSSIISPANIYYFSGSGNTLVAVRAVASTLGEHGVEVHVSAMERTPATEVNLSGTIGLAFPVAVFSTYPFVWKFLRSLPHADGTPVFMLDTLGGESGGIVGPLRSLMESKGYRPCGACEIKMPDNFFSIPEETVAAGVRRTGEARARQFALELLNGTAIWPRETLWSSFVRSISEATMSLWNSPASQRPFRVRIDRKKCTKCGTCLRVCPVESVEWQDGPAIRGRCEYCLRCVACCPQDAMALFSGKRVYRAEPFSSLVKEFTS